MKMTHDYTPLFAGVEAAFDAAVNDVVTEAQRRAPKSTGKFAASIRSERVPGPAGVLIAVVGSPLVSARVKEKGGFMQPRKHEYLFIPQADGSVRKVKSVRVRAQPTVTPAGQKFPELMTRRMAEKAR